MDPPDNCDKSETQEEAIQILDQTDTGRQDDDPGLKSQCFLSVCVFPGLVITKKEVLTSAWKVITNQTTTT